MKDEKEYNISFILHPSYFILFFAVTTLININREMFDEDKAVVSVFDHGFLFGDSIYEVIRTQYGELVFTDRHLERLHRSADRIALKLPCDDETIIGEIERTIAEAGNDESYVRLVISRGRGVLHLYPQDCDPKMVIIVMKFVPFPKECYTDGAKLSVVSIQRNPRNATNPDIKSGNYLNNVLAIMEARAKGALEALMLNHAGELTECTTSNIFVVHGDKIRTPHLESGLLQGITREVLLEIGPKRRFDMGDAKLTIDDLNSADEVFLSSTLKNVMPITRIDELAVGDGKPGRLTMQLAEIFEEFLKESLQERS
ncbi:MAG: branched-chain-amino acid aminotransferase [Planctomycetota bacterium]|nr:MAG: branched-chain-amino acid aminotransferase [Planctomycetota bacterium]